MLASVVRFLDLLTLGLIGFEAAQEIGAKTVAECEARRGEWERIMRALFGPELAAAIETLPAVGKTRIDPSTIRIEEWFSKLRDVARLATPAIPVNELEREAHNLGLESLAFRMRRAHDRLTAFLQRNSETPDHILTIAGRAFAEGRLTVDEVASLLGTDIPTAVWSLEAHGFSRTIERITLPDEERNSIYARMREDRIARGGKPHVDLQMARREAIATQRIEGIDARKWLPIE